MPRFAANLSMMYTEHPFLDRFAAAAADGFRAVEYLFPYAHEHRELAQQLADHGLSQVLFKPINTRDIPRYFLNRQDEAHAIVQEIDAPNLKVQMDLYHCQIVEGDLTMKLRQYLPTGRVGHIQIAGIPERHEPDLGEIN